MKKFVIFIALLLSVLVFTQPADAVVRFKTATSLTGGATGSLDAYDGSTLNNGDTSYTSVGGILYIHYLDADSALSESSPDVISPDSNAGDKRWILAHVQEGAATYYVDATETDQGATGNSKSLKYFVDDIGSSKYATIVLRRSGGGNTTTYTLTTSESVPSNINIVIENGAILDGAGTLTLDNPGQLIAQPTQKLFGTSITVAFTYGRGVYPEWWGATMDGTTDDSTAIQSAINAAETINGTVWLSGGTYVCEGLTVDSAETSIIGAGKRSTILKAKSGTTSDLLTVTGPAAGNHIAGNSLRDFQINMNSEDERGLVLKYLSLFDLNNVEVREVGDEDSVYIEELFDSAFYSLYIRNGGAAGQYAIYVKNTTSYSSNWLRFYNTHIEHMTGGWVKSDSTADTAKPNHDIDFYSPHFEEGTGTIADVISLDGETWRFINGQLYIDDTDTSMFVLSAASRTILDGIYLNNGTSASSAAVDATSLSTGELVMTNCIFGTNWTVALDVTSVPRHRVIMSGNRASGGAGLRFGITDFEGNSVSVMGVDNSVFFVALDDDNAGAIALPALSGWASVECGNTAQWAMFHYVADDDNTQSQMDEVSSGAATTLTTGALAGTTGADNVATISAHSDGKIYIENRTGSSRNFAITCLGGLFDR